MQDFYNAIKTLASGRVYPLVAPQGVDYPALVYTPVDQEHIVGMNGLHGVQRVRVQVDVYARTYAEAITLQDQVRDAVVASKSTVAEVRMVLTDFEEETRLYRVAVDYTYHR